MYFLLGLILLTHPLVNSQVPLTGCDAITNEGICFSYFTSSGINWTQARDECLTWGGDLATVRSEEENMLLVSTHAESNDCWIGINDIGNEGTFVWADGSNGTFRFWNPGQPDNGGNEDCGHIPGLTRWNDLQCFHTRSCHYCNTMVNVFGQVNSSVYSPLEENTILTTDTTLYCVTENFNTPQVLWSYLDLASIRNDLTSMSAIDVTTGVSTLYVRSDQPGYYSCEVSQDGGMSRTYTVEMVNTDLYPVPPTGCDAITNEGICFSYFTSSGFNWAQTRDLCLEWGGDLATVRSEQESILLESIGSVDCWIGINDIDNEGSFVWADGSTSSYRNWVPGQPNNARGNEDCGHIVGQREWNDLACTEPRSRYYCNAMVYPFGQLNSSGYSTIEENTILTTDTTLYCVTESFNSPQVRWSYLDLAGRRTNLIASTESVTGVSTLFVSSIQPGYYSCEVTRDGGMSRTYTVEMFNKDLNPVPPTGCDAITNEGTCFKYFTSSGLNWAQTRDLCLEWGGDLATVRSEQEGILLESIGSVDCWIGINDIDNEGSFVWVDGSTSSYRNWVPGQPNNARGNEDCGHIVGQREWNDLPCTELRSCYYCNVMVSPFGFVNSTVSSALSENTILSTDTTLYCVTETENTPQVTWSYDNYIGSRSELPATTNAITGVSTLSVSSAEQGNYSCEVTENGGMSRTYTVEMKNSYPVPPTGCDAITNEGTCFSYFRNFYWNWAQARDLCVKWGGDLATVRSEQESILLESIGYVDCWIGLNDIDNEGSFVWADGSTSSYRNWDIDEPNDRGGNEDCVHIITQAWNDFPCTAGLQCYYCNVMVNPFGQFNSSVYSPLEENTILTTDTTLYCVTEIFNTPQVLWSYLDLAGIRNDLTSMSAIDVTTGVSTLYVRIDQPGYYSCEVSQDGGMNRTYTVEIFGSDYFKVPGSPVLVSSLAQSASSILVVWRPPLEHEQYGVILSYNITFSSIALMKGSLSFVFETAAPFPIPSSTKYTMLFDRIEEGITYVITVRAVNIAGIGLASSPITESTPAVSPPNVPPFQVNMTNVTATPTSLTIVVPDVFSDFLGAELIGFTFSYQGFITFVNLFPNLNKKRAVDTIFMTEVTTVVTGPGNEFELMDLLPNYNYMLNVSANSPLGSTAPLQFPVISLSSNLPSSPPINIQAVPTASSQITYTWDNNLTTINGILISYNLYIAEMEQYPILISFPVSTIGPYVYVFTNLTQNTQYSISIAVVNAVGEGPNSTVVYATTHPIASTNQVCVRCFVYPVLVILILLAIMVIIACIIAYVYLYKHHKAMRVSIPTRCPEVIVITNMKAGPENVDTNPKVILANP
ncbi:hypothetical protein LOD99_2104 [Oopsacas minuta]|uniref:Uncharacterized protein n=1 Tax=Oopsacas minuta TaxID=111878 RepID=A0AAV7K400_9METZ|nr:hypothetical protein LOD99_2104 [Oopsacas minuta]